MTITVQTTVKPMDLVKLAVAGVAVSTVLRAKRNIERAIDRDIARREAKHTSK